MIDPLLAASRLASNGLEVQSVRMRIVSENLANAQSTGDAPGADPYSRKTVSLRAEIERALGAASVKVSNIGTDRAPFRTEYDPSSPAANERGMVKLPNVNMLVEMADMREANRSYEANLQVIKQARAMVAGMIDLLKS